MIKQFSRFCMQKSVYFQAILFFLLGRAEFLLPELLKKSSGLKSVAVVDPPRAGLHAKAISAFSHCGPGKCCIHKSRVAFRIPLVKSQTLDS